MYCYQIDIEINQGLVASNHAQQVSIEYQKKGSELVRKCVDTLVQKHAFIRF